MIYADNAATTAIAPEVLDAMMPYLTTNYGNPSSAYAFGSAAKKAISTAREQVAALIGAAPGEIVFTSGGTESNNFALRGLAAWGRKKGKGSHIISSAIEHHAVLHVLEALAAEGYEITLLPVDGAGRIHPGALKDAIRDDTIAISLMAANNEVGTVQDVKAFAEIAAARGVPLHTDAVQHVGHMPFSLAEMPVCALSLSGHKLHAPKGVGALYVKKGIALPPLLHGGGQEKNRRSGTENVAGIVALGAAAQLADAKMAEEVPRVTALRDRLIEAVLQIPKTSLTGDAVRRLPGNASFTVEGIEGEAMVLMLDMRGVCASSGSACSTGSLDPSHVLLSCGLSAEVAHGSVRFSLGRYNTDSDVAAIAAALTETVTKLRAMSPVWEQ